MNGLILRLNKAGSPVGWVDYEAAAALYTKNRVIWSLGDDCVTLHGGTNRFSGEQSLLTMKSIIAVEGLIHKGRQFSPSLCNALLFMRDQYLCLYCGQQYTFSNLTCDHVLPKASGGKDSWQNCVTACRSCNLRKGCRTPEEANMPLLAVPFKPNRHEYLVLQNRKILADQMDYLRSSSRQFRVQ